MTKPITETQIVQAICYSLMSTWDFSYSRRLEWEVWAAKWQECPECPAGRYEQCMNLGDVSRGVQYPKLNKRPHPNRISWPKLLEGLKERGYYRPSVEQQVRARMAPRD